LSSRGPSEPDTALTRPHVPVHPLTRPNLGASASIPSCRHILSRETPRFPPLPHSLAHPLPSPILFQFYALLGVAVVGVVIVIAYEINEQLRDRDEREMEVRRRERAHSYAIRTRTRTREPIAMDPSELRQRRGRNQVSETVPG
jgi:hypothetical protein